MNNKCERNMREKALLKNKILLIPHPREQLFNRNITCNRGIGFLNNFYHFMLYIYRAIKGPWTKQLDFLFSKKFNAIKIL